MVARKIPKPSSKSKEVTDVGGWEGLLFIFQK